MNKICVVKFGGSVLRDGEAVRKAAQRVKDELKKGNKLVIVVSALKSVTDQLLDAAESISSDIPEQVKDHIVRLGEEQSARLMTTALQLIGVDAVELTVDSPGFPIVTNDIFGDAEPIIQLCQEAVDLSIRPLLTRGKTPVICGFVGRSVNGEITTLGRGGSDTTATVLSRCLGARELVLIKDVEGVFSADPRVVEEAVLISEIEARVLHQMSSSGAKVIHDKVFQYKNDELDIRLVSDDSSISDGGTLVKGSVPSFEYHMHEKPVVMISLMGDANRSKTILNTLRELLRVGTSWFSLVQYDSRLAWVVEDDGTDFQNKLHPVVIDLGLNAVSVKGNQALFELKGRDLENYHEKIIRELREEEVAISTLTYDTVALMFTAKWDQREKVDSVLGAYLVNTSKKVSPRALGNP